MEVGRTPVHEEGGLSPNWDYTIEVPIKSMNDQIKISVLDQDFRMADLLGEFSFIV